MLHVHFETSPNARPSQSMTPSRVEPVLADRYGPATDLKLTYNDDPAQAERYLVTAEVLMVAGPVDLRDLKKRAPKLRWVQLSSAGAEHAVGLIPEDVLLTNVRGVHSGRAGEFGITAILMLNSRIPQFVTQQRERLWKQTPSEVIEGKTVSILGMGALGGACAKWAKTFGMTVIGVSRTGSFHEHADETMKISQIKEAFSRSDFVVVALPLTPETKGCVGRVALNALPAHAGLVNMGRGPVLDYNVLVEKLRNGSLAGAVLDVFEIEPLPQESELWSVPNLLITPHCGLDDPSDYGARCLAVFADNLKAYRSGQELPTRVNLSTGY